MKEFNAVAAKNKLIQWIRDWFAGQANDSCVAVLGISGGKDSSVCAALLAEALGRDRVYGILLPNGKQSDIQYSIDLVNHLGIKSITHNIRDEYDDIHHEIWGNLVENDARVSEQTKTNLAPRLRMTVLYAYSQSLNGRVCCTDNLSESYVGYSTQWGDNVGDFCPIKNYTSDEVIAIGRALGLPEKFLVKPPSDGLCGKTDEDNLGFTYRALNEYIRLGRIEDENAKKAIDHLHKVNYFKSCPIASFKF